MFAFPIDGGQSAEQGGRLSLSEFKTLRHVKDWLVGVLPASPSSNEPTPTTVPLNPSSRLVPHNTPAIDLAVDPDINLASTLEPTAAISPMATSERNFRSLVELKVGELPFAEPSALPVARFNDDQQSPTGVTVTANYVSAVFANLLAMAGRPGRAEDDHQVHYNGQREHVEVEAAKLASTVGAADLSLIALDACLLAQARWIPSASHEGGQPNSALRLVAEYDIPSWLSQGGVSLAMHLRQQAHAATMHWLTPGCVHSMMILNPAGLLVTGGRLGDDQRSSSLHLATWLNLQANQTSSVSAFEREARQLRLGGDWWVMAVDVHTAQRTLIECSQGVIVIEKSTLPVAADSGRIPSAQLWLDTDKHQLVVRTQLRPQPFACDEARIPLAAHQCSHLP